MEVDLEEEKVEWEKAEETAVGAAMVAVCLAEEKTVVTLEDLKEEDEKAVVEKEEVILEVAVVVEEELEVEARVAEEMVKVKWAEEVMAVEMAVAVKEVETADS